MGRFLIRLDGDEGPRYLEWSTIVDAPVTFGMTREELATHYRDEYGRAGRRGEGDACPIVVSRHRTTGHGL